MCASFNVLLESFQTTGLHSSSTFCSWVWLVTSDSSWTSEVMSPSSVSPSRPWSSSSECSLSPAEKSKCLWITTTTARNWLAGSQKASWMSNLEKCEVSNSATKQTSGEDGQALKVYTSGWELRSFFVIACLTDSKSSSVCLTRAIVFFNFSNVLLQIQIYVSSLSTKKKSQVTKIGQQCVHT